MDLGTIVVLVVLIGAFAVAVSIYNGLVTARNQFKNASANRRAIAASL